MTTAIDERINREITHGGNPKAVAQAEYGWASAAGQVRRARRIEFLAHNLPKEAKILEVGAGTGIQTAELLKNHHDITGIDISPDLLAIARKRAPTATYAVMDAHSPAFEPESFDAILGVSILHHLEWERALTSYFSLLRSGGTIRFSEPNLLNPQIFLQKNIPWLKQLAGDSPDEYAFTKWQIEGCLRKIGFSNITVRPFEFLHPATPERFIPLVQKLEGTLSKTPFAHFAGSLLIEAYKE
jgi:ubiquinone/menaquinone biosynthesis C-methylase UbiE